MEKSMVQELNGLTGSTVFVNRSFTTTVPTDDVYDLRKSRINNLPNYKKEDLSGKLNFVVIFQGIEIERLSMEVEALRVKLKDYERQIFNNGNYEVQIRELTEKCFTYEQEREEYREEIEKMNMICQKLYNELEEMKARYAEVDFTLKEKYKVEKAKNDQLTQELQKWKARFAAMERNKNQQIEDVRMMMETQRKSMIDREIRELTIRFQSERSSLQNEIKRLVDSLENRNNEIRKLQSHISRLEMTINELRESQRKIHEYENKVALISQQTIRLNEKLRIKQQEVDRLKEDLAQLTRALKQNEKVGVEYNKLVIEYQDLEADVGNLQNKNSQLEQENRRNKAEIQKLSQIQRMLDQYGAEIERLNQLLRDKIGENDRIKEQYSIIEVKYQESKNKEKRLPELETKINQLAGENNRISDVLKSRLGEMEDWKNKYSNLEKTIDKYIIIQKEKKGLENKINDLVRNNEDLKGKIVSNEKQITSLRNLEREISDYKRKISQMAEEIQRMNAIIHQKIQQIQQLKQFFKKIDSGLAQSKNIEQKLMENMKQVEKLVLQVDEARRQSDFFQDKLVIAQNQIRRLQNEHSMVAQQRDRLNDIAHQKSMECDQIKAQGRDKDNEIRNLRDVQQKFNDLQNKSRQMQNAYSDLEKKYKNQYNRAEQITTKHKNLNQDMEKIKKEGLMSPAFISQFMQIKQQCQLKDRQIQKLQTRFQTIDRIIKMLRGQLQKQAKMGQLNQEKINIVGQSINNFGDFVNKAIKMQGEITRLAQENITLESNARLMNFQIENTAPLGKSNVGPIISQISYQKTVTTHNEPLKFSHNNQRFVLGSVANHY